MEVSTGRLLNKTGIGASTSLSLAEQITNIEAKITYVKNTSNALIQGYNTKIAELEQAVIDGNILVQNQVTKLLEIERAQSTTEAVIQGHLTRIHELETATTDIDEVLKQYNETLNTRGTLHIINIQ